MRRIESLDYLRGLMALSVALYHFVGMSSAGWPPAETPLGRLGVYAVSVFYILSGLSLTLVYRNRLANGTEAAAYAAKRIFRIAPLFWLVVSLAVVLEAATSHAAGRPFVPDYWRLFLNYSLLFGFVKPDAYISMDAWSIGNELVFYTLFPFLILAGRAGRPALAAVGAVFFLLYCAFAFLLLDPARPLAAQFTTYINPFNQAFLFLAGVVMGFALRPAASGRRIHLGLAIVLAVLFCLVPGSGDQIAICTGSGRLALTFICMAFVALVYVSDIRLPGTAGHALRRLGEMSYSVYLLHSLVGVAFVLAGRELGLSAGPAAMAILLLAGLPLTLLLSWASYRWVEQPMIRMGARLADRVGGRSAPAVHPLAP